MFEEFHKKLAFGFMRLPLLENGEIDIKQIKKMVDTFIENGFNYFDTAHGYMDEKSEPTLKECLVDRYPRNAFLITDKLTDSYIHSAEDIRPFFEKRLKTVGVKYFDNYLMHAVGSRNYDKYQRCNAFEIVSELKKEGKIRHIGISFHDTAEFLDNVLTEHPEIEIVQLQFNYIDYDNPAVQSKACYDVCVKHGKPCLVMEPVKGGSLVKIPAEAQKVFDNLNNGSNASYAIRFAAGFDNIKMVLSGMSTLAQVQDNVAYMKDFVPLSEEELTAIGQVKNIIKGKHMIPCTSCRYCTAGCPKHIKIPEMFSCMNAQEAYNDWNSAFYYNILVKTSSKASECIKCGQCERVCPQHLKIRDLLEKVADTFE